MISSSSSPISIQNMNSNPLEPRSSLDNTSIQSTSLSSNSSISSTHSLDNNQSTRASISSYLKNKTSKRSLFGNNSRRKRSTATYQTKTDYLLFRKAMDTNLDN
ncbi:hypothetical protein BDC45DRAFT_572231 [Circinella umbellata]|nr:hypothetical protein BDC45DRAFT_572231 [Circinella umbellata]